MPLLQFRSQRSEEVGLEHWSKGIAQTMIKIVNDEEGTNSRCQGQEGFLPNRQEDVRHNEEGIKVDSGAKRPTGPRHTSSRSRKSARSARSPGREIPE